MDVAIGYHRNVDLKNKIRFLVLRFMLRWQLIRAPWPPMSHPQMLKKQGKKLEKLPDYYKEGCFLVSE